jgi:hypothetical protein
VSAVAIAAVVVNASLETADLLGAFKTNTGPSTPGGGSQALYSVEISPSSITLGYSKTQTFSAMAIDTGGTDFASGVSFLWELDPPSLGSLNGTLGSSVAFNSPTINATGGVSVRATFEGPTKSATANVMISSTEWFSYPSISYFAAVPTSIALGNSATLKVT